MKQLGFVSLIFLSLCLCCCSSTTYEKKHEITAIILKTSSQGVYVKYSINGKIIYDEIIIDNTAFLIDVMREKKKIKLTVHVLLTKGFLCDGDLIYYYSGSEIGKSAQYRYSSDIEKLTNNVPGLLDESSKRVTPRDTTDGL